MTMTASRLDTALKLAELGYYVAPAEPRTKHSLYIQGLCENGWNSATRDSDTIRAMWSAHPDAGIGINLDRSEVVAIDCDSLDAENEAQRNGLSPTVERHSRHVAYLYRRPERCPTVRACKMGRSGEIDILSAGGVVVFNIHEEGHNVFLSEMIAVDDLYYCPQWAVNIAAIEAERQAQKDKEHSSSPGRHSDNDAVAILRGRECQRGGCPCHYSITRGHGITHCPNPNGHRRGDVQPSLNVSLINRKLLVHCFSGCTQDEVIASLDEINLWPAAERLSVNPNGHSASSVPAVPFPVDALPEAFQRYVEHVSRLKVCPPEYVALPLLVGAGAMLGNVVQLVLNSSWTERPQIFAAIVGPPGAKKSPAIASALSPIRAIQQKLGDAYAKALTHYKAEKARYDKIPKKERDDHDPPVAPTYSHVMTNDVTIEKLAEMLSQSKGILLSHDELAAWVLSMDQYRSGKGADRQHFLTMWTGTSFKVDRLKNPEPIYVKHPCLGIIGGIQPEMLTSLVDKQGRSDGFLDRILWAYPESLPGHWVDDDEPDDSGINDVFQMLYDCYGTTDLIGNHVPLNLRFSDEAKEIWRKWYNETEDDITQQRIERSLEGSWAKMPSQCARLAVILHMIDGENTNMVSAYTLQRAIRITEYFKHQCRNVFASLADAVGKDDGLRVLEYLKEHGEVPQTEISRKVFSGKKRGADVLNALLSDLESRGLVVRRAEQTTGRAKTVWGLA